MWPEEGESGLVPARLFVRQGGIVAHVEWQGDPVGWAESKLGVPRNTLQWSCNRGYGVHEWDGTVDPLSSLLEAVGRQERAIAVESGTGVGAE